VTAALLRARNRFSTVASRQREAVSAFPAGVRCEVVLLCGLFDLTSAQPAAELGLAVWQRCPHQSRREFSVWKVLGAQTNKYTYTYCENSRHTFLAQFPMHVRCETSYAIYLA
jgi:hypothetical protein